MMSWINLFFGTREKGTPQKRETLRWTSHRGDEWWCDEASAGFSCGNFTIGSFGRFTTASRAMELIRDARDAFPDATVDIYLDSSTESVVRMLNERGLLVTRDIELSPRTRVARVETISIGDSNLLLNTTLPNKTDEPKR